MPSASVPDHVWIPRYDWGNWNLRWGKNLPPPPPKKGK